METFSSDAFGDDGDTALMERTVNEHARTLRFSNFMITISTNVVPKDGGERNALVYWLRDVTGRLFDDWGVLNGTVIKPAGSDNKLHLGFPDDHKIVSVKSRVAIEKGEQKGQMHAHVLLEIAHLYTEPMPGQRFVGVHVNCDAMRQFLDREIYSMQISYQRLPQKIYVNSKLLTKGTDRSAKWLTLAYISKDRDKNGLNLKAQRQAATAEERNIHEGMLHADAVYNSLTWQSDE